MTSSNRPQSGAGVHLKNLYNDYVYFWPLGALESL